VIGKIKLKQRSSGGTGDTLAALRFCLPFAWGRQRATAKPCDFSNLKDIVFNGPFKGRGMPDFTGKLKDEDVVKIQAFIQGTADAVRPKK
jgi:hypothetical protein